MIIVLRCYYATGQFPETTPNNNKLVDQYKCLHPTLMSFGFFLSIIRLLSRINTRCLPATFGISSRFSSNLCRRTFRRRHKRVHEYRDNVPVSEGADSCESSVLKSNLLDMNARPPIWLKPAAQTATPTCGGMIECVVCCDITMA